ncbi:hypothetical protein EDI_095260 [Entamoeba dispar SAW760]|uniref:Uncharacterized protein n=1 Tax=Entamoeba dispar (strain ATCC PRA-260 / SAW760) TaxID=370354 RepID=B0ET11_ENTDS|nr:uncharacterized protein EDI_095260 [Entamoeba dispar SAW760]EDR22333.1 hypothetical protein EDI_095260 [Entamoeba dispar SAW760]|eukprot:EDR22333.1 hypothetical protein EDI_095260 [Entamoeba dispar SAW760]
MDENMSRSTSLKASPRLSDDLEDEYTEEDEYSSSSDYTSSTDDDEEKEMEASELLESWSEAMKKLKFMVELYSKEKEENTKLIEHINKMATAINEMKLEIASLAQSQTKAINDLMMEKKSHAATLKKLEMCETHESEKPFNGTLRCNCEIVISNGEVENIIIVKDDEKRWKEIEVQKEYLMKRVVELTQQNALINEEYEDLKINFDMKKNNMENELNNVQQSAREREVSLVNNQEMYKSVALQFLTRELPLFKKNIESIDTIQKDIKLKTEFASFIMSRYGINITDVLNGEKSITKIQMIPLKFRKQKSSVTHQKTIKLTRMHTSLSRNGTIDLSSIAEEDMIDDDVTPVKVSQLSKLSVTNNYTNEEHQSTTAPIKTLKGKTSILKNPSLARTNTGILPKETTKKLRASCSPKRKRLSLNQFKKLLTRSTISLETAPTE